MSILVVVLNVGIKWISVLKSDMKHEKKSLMPYANSEGPDQHAHPCSLIWAFSICEHILQYPLILLVGNEGPDQPARMRRLIRTCVAHKLQKGPFCALRIILHCASNVILRIYHGCEGQTEKSVLRAGTTRLAEWCQTVIPRKRFFYLSLTPMLDSFSCIPFISESGFLIMQSLRLRTSTRLWRQYRDV